MPATFPQFELVDALRGALSKTRAHVEAVGPWGTAKTLLALQTAQAMNTPLLLLAAGRIEAEAIHEDLITLVGEDRALLLPAWEVLPTDTMAPADDIVAERMHTLEQLTRALDSGEALYAVAPLRSLLQYVVNPGSLQQDMLRLAPGEEYELEGLLEKLISMGYHREVMVENRGETSVRGGIVDIFPISSELPVRLEFFGDELESIRNFEPETQRSIDTLESVTILPRSEKAMLAKRLKENQGLSPLTKYFPKTTLVALDEPLAIAEEGAKLSAQFEENPYHMSWEAAEGKLKPFPRLDLAQVAPAKREGVKRFALPTRQLSAWTGHIEHFWEQLKQWDLESYAVRILCVNSGERRRFIELLEEQGYRPGQDAFDLRLEIGRLRAGFTAETPRMALLSEREIFGRHYMRRTRRRFEAGATVTQFSDLKTGDYIVHEVHGIGRYMGLRRFSGKAGDFMALQYAAGDTLYVPVTHIDQVQKYVGGENSMPRIDKLGGATWRRTKARVKKAVKDMTEDLVRLYAAREKDRGHAFAPDTPWQQEFEDTFEYEETPDQERAILEVKRDMESPRPMDRLLCGDVGYGKTEVALRSAFKAVMDGKQVALLAPTTVLTQQHYATFRERMADFPVRIELLNRFRQPREIRQTVAALPTGEIDIVIGTHRLLSKDIAFKDIGLLIVDEEQRFGVAHKERLKQLRTHVDVLTLSATPIPRTLHFSLIGVRDMSVINTAPNDRLPIHTCIEAWDQDLIREAIVRELGRQGQVFFLHNRVQTIDQVAVTINKLVPTARVAVGHGQMAKHDLEKIMTAFINQEIDVLVCTTIIGSGIDIPNANTIIVDRADMFGLAELYQIRGRVGRYKHRAFAYLLVPGDRALSEEAQQRLKALEEFSALGSGFRIAMRDLEIRGAGDLLGADQSGHIAAVGYETYRQMIAEAVAEIKGEAPRHRNLPPFEVGVDAFIPEEYVPTAQQKMALYRRIAAVQSPEEVDELRAELADRFGNPPGPVMRLLDVMRIRAQAAELEASSLVLAKGVLTIAFNGTQFLSRKTQHELNAVFGDALEFAWNQTPTLRYRLETGANPLRESLRLLHSLAECV